MNKIPPVTVFRAGFTRPTRLKMESLLYVLKVSMPRKRQNSIRQATKIVVLLLSLFISSKSFSQSYGWVLLEWWAWGADRPQPKFPTPAEAVAYTEILIPGSKVSGYEFLYNGMLHIVGTMPSGSPDHLSIFNLYYARSGDSCPPNTTENPTTYICGNDGDKGPPPPLNCASDPINIAAGNSFQVETDYQGSGAFPLSFNRAYNSLDGLWRHNHSTHLRFSGKKLALVMAHGRESFFTISGSTVTAAPTELGQLAKVTEGWVYTVENNERYTFDASGRLTRWANTAGAVQQQTYANGKVTVTDNLGHSLSFSEDAQHQPLSLVVDGLQITYSYNTNKRLTQLTRIRGGQTEQRTFHYEDPRNNALLTGITDERGVRFATWTFDDKGRATSSEHADGAEHTQVAYNTDGSSTVTNELGKSTVYRFTTIGGSKRVSAVEGEASANCPNSNSTFTYDDRGLLKTKTDNKGHVTSFDYNARGLEISRTEASGAAQARTITTTWHPTLNLPLKVTEPDRVTTYTYDAQGRQTSQTSTAL